MSDSVSEMSASVSQMPSNVSRYVRDVRVKSCYRLSGGGSTTTERTATDEAPN